MSLTKDTICEIFDKNVSLASLDFLTSIKSDHLFENAKVINQSSYNIFVSFDVLDNQITISLISFAI